MTNLTSHYVIYGIKNCDTMKKARLWLDEHGMTYQFHDYRKEGINADLIKQFITYLGWEALINKRGTTWRQLDEQTKDKIIDAPSAIQLMLEHPAIIKRPILVSADNQYILGFKADTYQQFCA